MTDACDDTPAVLQERIRGMEKLIDERFQSNKEALELKAKNTALFISITSSFVSSLVVGVIIYLYFHH